MKVNCEICRDLLPLVCDGVASASSAKAVAAHLQECEVCRNEAGTMPELPKLQERRVLGKLRRRLCLLALGIAVFGALLGLGLSNSQNMFYNSLLMPMVGTVGFFALRRRAWILAPGLFGLSYVWLLLQGLAEGMASYAGLGEILVTPVYFSLIYTIFCGVGILIGLLLHLAFRKETKNENMG